MAFVTPYYTSQDIIEAVKRKISLPISQETFTEKDILRFANEEMFISQVPSVLEYHEEYFVNIKSVPLRSNISRYAVPSRSIGMKLRDLYYADQNGNLTEMTRIDEGDKAFWQKNVGANNSLHKFYLQGDDVIVTPSVTDGPTGSLVFVFFLRPNQLVDINRAATITGFSQSITLNNALIQPLDTVSIGSIPFTAVSSGGGTISSITANGTQTLVTTSANHQLSNGQTVIISGSDSVPSINGTYTIQVGTDKQFYINIEIGTAGTTGSFTSPNQFVIGGSGTVTAANLVTSINSIGDFSASSIGTQVTVVFDDIHYNVETTRTVAFVIPSTTLGIVFNSVSSTYQDPDTGETLPLFTVGADIDLLQTNPGHRIWQYDIPIQAIVGNTVTFLRDDILIPTGSIGSGEIPLGLPDLVIGDYMCLANEAIIPQLPPDLHNGLAERTAARILASMGDQAGLQVSMAKIKEIDGRQGNLLDNRVEGAPLKVVNRYSLLRLGKTGIRRRY